MSGPTRETVREDGDAINWTRTDEGVRIYDEDDPDAWVQVEFEAGVPPEKRLFMVCDECGAVVPQRSPPGSATVCGVCDAEYDHLD